MQAPDYVSSYRDHLKRLIAEHGRERAMELVVGGDYAGIGGIEASALITLGLQRDQCLIDIGCGSGRLPYRLRNYLQGSFIGTDILEDALDYAKEKCNRPDWRFIPHHEPSIPAADSCADFVTFFSVFTHLLDEDSFRFLQDASRVLKPNGRVVFSFLDFECPSHWPVFEATLGDRDPKRVINKFLSKGAIRKWADVLGYTVDHIYDGLTPWIAIEEPFRLSDGRLAQSYMEFGQSVAVLTKEPR